MKISVNAFALQIAMASNAGLTAVAALAATALQRVSPLSILATRLLANAFALTAQLLRQLVHQIAQAKNAGLTAAAVLAAPALLLPLATLQTNA
jgi:hypothetical protein